MHLLFRPAITGMLLLMMVAITSAAQVIAQEPPVELEFLWYSDGVEGDVMRGLLDSFEAANPDIVISLNIVTYNDLHPILESQLSTGGGPDLARITNLARFHGHYLDLTPYLENPEAWAATFPPPALQWLRQPGIQDHGLYGFPSEFTVNGGFVNVSLFEAAGISLPTDETTLAEWVALAEQVATATGTPYAIAIDRSGHRIWGPSLNLGAQFINPETGAFTIDTPGFREFAGMLLAWHAERITPIEIWAGAGGRYADGKDYFVHGEVVFYYSGSWQVGAFASEIGDNFKWQVINEPCGPAGCTTIPGGAAIVALANTEYPEQAARLIEYLSRKEMIAQFSEQSLFLPGQVELLYEGLQYPSNRAVMNTFVAQIPRLSDQAYALQGSPVATAVLNPEMRDRLSQVIVGELTLDQAIEAMQSRMDAVCAEVVTNCLPLVNG